MIDHVYISVTNIERSLAFYVEALKPLGWSPVGNYDAASGPQGVPDLDGVGDDAFGSGKARTYFASGYYAANVADFDGNRLEFVHKAWNPKHS